MRQRLWLRGTQAMISPVGGAEAIWLSDSRSESFRRNLFLDLHPASAAEASRAWRGARTLASSARPWLEAMVNSEIW